MSFWQAARREASGALRTVRYDFVQVLIGQGGTRRAVTVAGLTALLAAGGIGTAFAVTSGDGRDAPAQARPAVSASDRSSAADGTLTDAAKTPSASPSRSASHSPSASPSAPAGAGEPAPAPIPGGHSPTVRPRPTRTTPKPRPTTPKPTPTTASPSPSPSPSPSTSTPSASNSTAPSP